MGRASREKQSLGHRQQIAAQRAAARRRQVRNRLLLAGTAIIAVIAVTVAIVVVRTGSRAAPAAPPANGPTGAALASVVGDLTSVPPSVLDRVGTGSITGDGVGSPGTSGAGYLVPVKGSALTSAGKPEVLYVGADFCPYCAAVRWPLIVALSRFGTFSGLTTTRSGITNGAGQAEPYPGTATWTFYGSTFTSKYLAFSGVELATSKPDASTGGYLPLQQLTAAQEAVYSKYDPQGSVPFLDIGNAHIQMSSLAPYGPQALANLTWSQIAAALHQPSSTLAREIDGSANYLTAAFCSLTGNQPATACTTVVRALEPRLGQ
jgi:hypothetical protein